MGRPFPLKIAPSHGASEPPSNTWSLGPTQVLNPNGISNRSAVLGGLTGVTNRQTDRQRDRQSTLLGLLRTVLRSKKCIKSLGDIQLKY